MKKPCRECQFREVGCHSKCESYKQYRASLDKLNEEKNMQDMSRAVWSNDNSRFSGKIRT